MFFNKLTLDIAKTHLVSRKRQTLIAMLGVTFGIGMFIAMVGLMTGIDKFLENMMLENTPHIRIYNPLNKDRIPLLDRYEATKGNFKILTGIKPKDEDPNFRNGNKMLQIIREHPKVEGASPVLATQVFYHNGTFPIGGTINGVDMLEYDKLFNMRSKMDEGRMEDIVTFNNGIIIGVGLAKKLGVQIKNYVNITANNGTQLRLYVVGIFSTGIAQIDDFAAYASLTTAQKIMGENSDFFTDINIKLKDIRDASEMAKVWEQQFGYTALDWKKSNADVLTGFVMRNAITTSVSIALLIVAAFGIYNVLTMMIYEKMNDIAIMKAVGFKGKDVRSIFMTEALIIGFIGGAMGLVVGLLLSLGLNAIPFSSGSIKNIDHLPVNFDIKYYVFGMLFALGTTALAGWLPSRKASKVDPIEIIRGK